MPLWDFEEKNHEGQVKVRGLAAVSGGSDGYACGISSFSFAISGF